MRRSIRVGSLLVLAAFLAGASRSDHDSGPGTRASITIDPELLTEVLTGRVFLLVTPLAAEPRLLLPFTFAYYFNDPALPYPQLFGLDVEALAPGEPATIDGETLGFPLKSLADLDPGEYSVQAMFHVYTEFPRAEGPPLWMHMDRGEGQQFHISPGNLYSDVERLRLDPQEGFELDLVLANVIPPITKSPDSEYIRRIEIESELASEFWGREMLVSATVLLPEGYDAHPDVHYPVLYYQGHFFEDPPLGFPEEVPPDARAARRFYFPNRTLQAAWSSPDFPRMIVVTFQHPTPFYDDSYFVDSANNGPWGRVFLEELLPAVEERFRILREPYARVMTGGSTGGWVSAALQIYHPDTFGGAWIFCPDPVDFRELLTIDIYRDEHAFEVSGYTWQAPERFGSRSPRGQPRVTVRQLSQLTLVLGSKGRSGEFLDMWNALYGPVGEDGYPQPLWDHETGIIDREVARYWRDNGFDLRHHLQSRWSELGPDLVGKLHFSCGDMDNFYLNLAMYRMEEFLERTSDPHYGGSFYWARPMVGHSAPGYEPWPMALLEEMADEIARNAPPGADVESWRY